MNSPSQSTLESFHQFITEKLQSDVDAQMSPEQALALWRERQETIGAIREGLADVEAGRTKPLEQFLRDFEAARGIAPE